MKHRWVRFASGGSAEGDFSESGKQHGQWTYVDDDWKVTHTWYWYGEEITEGEWYLRNK